MTVTATEPPTIEWWVYPVVLGGLVAATWLLHIVVMRAARRRSRGRRFGVAALFVGDDGRTSTSKLQAMLWTYAVLWALVSLLALGVDGFRAALDRELREEYLLLLGGPYLAAIAAKGITTKREDDPKVPSKVPKVLPAGDRSTLTERVAETVTNDAGSVDLGDFQYASFTLLTLTYFAWAFIDKPHEGLPAIPATLLVLMGVSQGAYVAKKVLLPDTPPPPAADAADAPPPAPDAPPPGSTAARRRTAP